MIVNGVPSVGTYEPATSFNVGLFSVSVSALPAMLNWLYAPGPVRFTTKNEPVSRVTEPCAVRVPVLLPGESVPPLATVIRPATTPVPPNSPELLTVTVPVFASAPATSSLPPLMVVAPEKVLVPASVSVPVPALVMPKVAPLIGEFASSAAVLEPEMLKVWLAVSAA